MLEKVERDEELTPEERGIMRDIEQMREENQLHCIFGDEDDVKASDMAEPKKDEQKDSVVLLDADSPLVDQAKLAMVKNFRTFIESYHLRRHL